MARYRKAEESEPVSVTTLLFPVLFVLYCEWVFAFFSQTALTVYKILFSLALGFIALALSRITPLRALNFFLQSVFLLACWLVPVGQFLYFKQFGMYYTLSGERNFLRLFAELPGLVAQNAVFSLLMLLPVLLLFTLQRAMLLHRRSLMGLALGANWLEAPGALLLAVILSFTAVTVGLSDTRGEQSPARLITARFEPAESTALFGAVPELLLDVKYNVLHLEGEDTVKYFIVRDGRDPEPVDYTPAPETSGENS